ncbi:MAG: tail fiber domain-containing protein, partial [Pseudomonadota bacterium]|nr:tail fiber domain-containing protein [Pseudomonadota bacterium]
CEAYYTTRSACVITASGSNALRFNTTGIHNTALGNFALNSTTTGGGNTAIGYNANVTDGAFTNATAIGHRARVNASDKVRLGNTDVTVIEGQVAFSNASDERIKTDITETKYGIKTALSLKPVDYTMISNEQRNVGFIAQDVQKLVPEAVSGVEGDLEKGETLSIAYTTLIPVLTKAIQEQNEAIEKQNKMIATLQKEVEMLKKKNS